MERDSTFIDLSPILNDEPAKKKCKFCSKCQCFYKCKMPLFLKDLLNLLVPIVMIIGGIFLVILLIAKIF